jgi:hypothetical protein
MALSLLEAIAPLLCASGFFLASCFPLSSQLIDGYENCNRRERGLRGEEYFYKIKTNKNKCFKTY